MNTPFVRYLCNACLLFLILCSLTCPAFADYTVTGTFRYLDRQFDTNGFSKGDPIGRPIRYADLQVFVNSTATAYGTTGSDGTFTIPVPGGAAGRDSVVVRCYASSIVNSQAPFKAPARDIQLQVVSSYSTTSTPFSFGSAWSVSSNTFTYAGTPTLTMGDITALHNQDPGRAFNIWDVLIDGVEFVNSIRGSNPSTPFTVAWSSSSSFPNFGGWYDNRDSAHRFAVIGSPHAQDDPLIYQQFGHFIADLYSKLDAPIGFPVLTNDNQDLRVAWAEGLSLFLGSSIRQFKGYSHSDYYMLTDINDNVLISFDLQTITTYLSTQLNTTPPYPQFKTCRGDASILAVAAALWDITNGPVLQRDFSDVWKVLDYLSHQTFQGFTAERFWDAWFSPSINNGNASEMQTIFANHGIEFAADAQEPDDSPNKAPLVPQAQLPVAAAGAKVLINEINLEDGGAVELYNAGTIEANLEGWFLAVSRGSNTVTATIPSVRLQPGQFLTFTGRATNGGRDRMLFPGSTTLPLQQGQDGACALLDSTNTPRDFVRWGSSRYFPPPGTNFTGTAPTPDPGTDIGRNFAAQDTDAASDWTVQPPTLGTYNLSGEQKHHTFYPAGDVDYAAFNAKSSMWYLVEALNLSNGADTVLDILSGDGTTVLTTNDDSSLGAGSQIVWKPASDGKYYIRCRRYDGSTNLAQYGSYDLRIIESSAPFFAGQSVTLTVSKPGQGGRYNTVADAIADAYDGDIVEIIDSGTYQENLVQNVQNQVLIYDKSIGKSITLKAQRGKSPIIDGRGSGLGTILAYGKNVRIESIMVYGGSYGIAVVGGAATIVNTIVARTTQTSGGVGGMGIEVANTGVTATISHCTLSNNYQGIIVFNSAKVKVVNSIVYGNTQLDICEADQSGKCIASGAAGAGMTVRNTISSKSTYPGSNGNINSDPKFVNPTSDNYRLQASSPAIDKADPADPDEPAIDADGLGRSLPATGSTSGPDMGAYEYLNPTMLTSTAVFPQIAVGGTTPEYRTSIVAVNTGALTSTMRIVLTQSDGSPLNVQLLNAFTPKMMEAVAAAQDMKPLFAQNGSSFDVAVMPSGTLRLETSGTTTLAAGYAKLLSNLPLNGTALFKTIQGSTITGEAGVGLSTPSTSFRIYVDNKNNAWSGYAVANTGSNTASITMTLRNADGTTVGSPKNITLPPGQHFAHGADSDFAAAAPGFEGMIEFASGQDQPISAVALRYDNTSMPGVEPVFSTIPVLADNDLAKALYFPQVADGRLDQESFYRTNFILVNPSTGSTTAHLQFYDKDGKPLPLSIGGQLQTSYDMSIASHGVAHLLTEGSQSTTVTGWVKVTCPVAIGGSAIFQMLNGTTINSEAGVAASPPASRLVVYVETINSAYSGLAINNPNTAAVNVTLRLRDSSGTQIDTYTRQLPALGYMVGWFTDWFGSYPDFEGTLEVISSSPVSAVALRYDGQIFATLPVIVP